MSLVLSKVESQQRGPRAEHGELEKPEDELLSAETG